MSALTELSRDVQLASPIMSDNEIDRTFRIAKALAIAKVSKGALLPEQAFAKIVLGRDLGLSPTQAVMGLHIVEGNLQISGVMLASFVRRSLDYDYEVVELDGDNADEAKQRCTLRFVRIVDGERQPLEPDITYTTAQARKLRSFTIQNGPWTTARRNMLFWRAMSDGVKMHCPELLGGIPLYTEADVDSTAEPVEDAPEPMREAEVVDADDVLSDDARAELMAAIEAAGVDPAMVLTAAGLTEDASITTGDALEMRKLLADFLPQPAVTA